ncbi:hypothetical protein [Pseudomonas nicosulfuronedens]
MKKLVALSIILLTGCTGAPKSDVFYTGPANYDKIEKNPTIAKTKVFVKRGYSCNYLEKPPEAGALVAILAPVLAEKAINYGFDKVKEYNTYLKSDVTLTGSALLAYNDKPAAWPSPDGTNQKAAKKTKYIQDETEQLTQYYLNKSKKNTRNDKELQELISKNKDKFSSQFDMDNKPNLTMTNDDVCVLVVAGNYKSNASNESLATFIKKTNAAESRITDYQSYTPTIESADADRPFKGLVGDPTLVYEMHIIATPDTEGSIVSIVPQNLFYPNALHKGSINRVERKITIITTLGENIQPIVLEHMKAGAEYRKADIADKWVKFSSPKDKVIDTVKVSISEGPDKTIVTDLLDGVETQREPTLKKGGDKVNDLLGIGEKEEK